MPNLNDCHRAVELAAPVLNALVPFYSIDEAVDPDVEDSGGKGRPRRNSQRVAKRLKRAGQIPAVDTAIFAKINAMVPSSKDEAMNLALHILDDQRDILKVSGQYTSFINVH